MVQQEQFPRKFSAVEIAQTKELISFMSIAHDVSTWNNLRRQAKAIWSERIISAVDGMRKWVIKYDRQTKTKEVIGCKIS